MEQSLGPQHPDVAIVIENYDILLFETGKTGETAVILERVKSIRDNHAKQYEAS